MDLGVLTTVFTPPSSCLASSAWWWISASCFAGPDCVYQLQGPPDLQNCFPPSYTPYSTAYYSPGVCPSGYTPACTSFNTVGPVTETAYTCCPMVQSFTCLSDKGPNNEWPWQQTLGCASAYAAVTTFPSATVVSDGQTTVSTSLVWSPPGEINAYSVQVRFQSTDIIPSPTSTSGMATPTITSPSQPDALPGYCATPEFTLLLDAQSTAIFYVQVIGCIDDKLDCCPFQVTNTASTTTATVTSVTETTIGGSSPPVTETTIGGSSPPVTETITIGSSSPVTQTVTIESSPPPIQITPYYFPGASLFDQIVLENCPDGYNTFSSVCCPSGYALFSTLLGGITPCYTTLTTTTSFPPLPGTTVTVSGSPITQTTTFNNAQLAMPVKHVQSGLSKSEKVDIGVGVGVGVGVPALAALAAALLYRKLRKNRNENGGSM